MDEAFQRLDKLTPEEALMVAAETMVIIRDIHDTVKVVDKSLGNVDERVKDVDGKIGSVIKGGSLYMFTPGSVLTLSLRKM